MSIEAAAAFLYAAITGFVVAFQLALALGAPWGSYAMGGAFPGKYPPAMRIAAAVQAIILTAIAIVLLAAAEVIAAPWGSTPGWIAWLITALLTVGLVLNLITPSAGERRIWAPTIGLMMLSAALIALGA